MLDRDDGPGLPPSRFRWWFVIAWWVGATLASFLAPALLLLGALPGAIAYLVVALGTLDEVRSFLARRDPVVSPSSRWVSVVLVTISLASVLGAVAAREPSLGYLVSPHVVEDEYALSLVIAPVAFAVIGFVAVRALLAPSLRRIAMVIMVTFVCWPILIATRALSEPLIEFDHGREFVVVTPWALYAYAAAAGITSLAAIALMRRANQLAALPTLPRAQLATTS